MSWKWVLSIGIELEKLKMRPYVKNSGIALLVFKCTWSLLTSFCDTKQELSTESNQIQLRMNMPELNETIVVLFYLHPTFPSFHYDAVLLLCLTCFLLYLFDIHSQLLRVHICDTVVCLWAVHRITSDRTYFSFRHQLKFFWYVKMFQQTKVRENQLVPVRFKLLFQNKNIKNIFLLFLWQQRNVCVWQGGNEQRGEC